jgi:hypothetical protein
MGGATSPAGDGGASRPPAIIVSPSGGPSALAQLGVVRPGIVDPHQLGQPGMDLLVPHRSPATSARLASTRGCAT